MGTLEDLFRIIAPGRNPFEVRSIYVLVRWVTKSILQEFWRRLNLLHASMSPQRRNLSIAPIRVFIVRHNLGAALPLSDRKIFIFYRPARLQYFIMSHSHPDYASFAKFNAFLRIAFDYYSLVEISTRDGPGWTIPPAFRLDYLVTAFERMKGTFAQMLADLGNPPGITTLLEGEEDMYELQVKRLVAAGQGEALRHAWGELETREPREVERWGADDLSGVGEQLSSLARFLSVLATREVGSSTWHSRFGEKVFRTPDSRSRPSCK